MAELEWDSPGVRQGSVEAPTPLLSYGEHQASAIGKVDLTGIHCSTQLLQISLHCPMVERGGLLGPPRNFTTLSPKNKGQRKEQAGESHR